jgi:ribosome-associated heat shock protein Hsp15
MTEETRVRIDKWLWAARFYKTRSLAVEALDGGKILVNGEKIKRSRLVGPGDEVRVRMGPFEHIVIVKAVSEKRGSAAIAATLFDELPESKKAREAMAAHVRAMNSGAGYETGRPSKKDRRDIERFRRKVGGER